VNQKNEQGEKAGNDDLCFKFGSVERCTPHPRLMFLLQKQEHNERSKIRYVPNSWLGSKGRPELFPRQPKRTHGLGILERSPEILQTSPYFG